MVLFFVLWVHAELECCLRAFPQKWTFSSGPRVSPVLLCCVTLTLLEYLHSIQPQSFPWGPTPQPEPPHPAPTCCRQMSVWASFWLEIAIWHNLCAEFSLFRIIVLPSEVPKLSYNPTCEGGSCCLETSPSSGPPPQDGFSRSFVSLFVLPHSK